MQSPGKLLSTLSVALLVLANVLSADTPPTLTSPSSPSSSSLRSNGIDAETSPVLKDKRIVEKHSKLDDERLLAAYYGKVILHPYLHHLNKDPPHPKPPMLSRSRYEAQQALLKLGGVREDQPFETWITRFISGNKKVQTPVFQHWVANELSPEELAELLEKAGKSHQHYAGSKRMVAKYRRYRNAPAARSKSQ
ncbi:unnamed protein product [Hyaloperonospora brassicae]|uniref:RxLR effector protein n=1 Tax=Hyaloperonospora brassicae TaxID=162125 RepID=A0AAV0TTZ6_HYABA|nr:unnamed protein product [Hyaloperonospora brassicae]